jgi:penicillin-binding protein 1A
MTKKKSIKKKPKKGFIKGILIILALVFIIGAGTAIGVITYASRNLPAWDPQQLTGVETTFLLDDQGQIMSSLHAGENRTEISLDKVPQDLINAFIAIEDQDYYKHHGINIKGIARAMISNIRTGDLTGQGASTITQQLARNAFLSFEKRWERKVKEAILAFKLESAYSKDEILTMYLNKINFGAGAYGVQAAAKTYFGKDVSDLTLEESALLAGIPNGPEYFNPFKHFDRAKARQEAVLNNMYKCGYISHGVMLEAKEKPLSFQKIHNADSKYGFFIDAAIEETLEILKTLEIYEDPDSAIYRSGLKIYTTMDADLQNHAETIFKDPNNFPNQSKNGEQIQAAMVVIDHSNGEVKSLMGGRSYEQKRGFNRATMAYRQPGSSIKPIAVYSPALEDGFMPFYVLDDSPVSYKTQTSVWSPENYDHSYRGLITMRTAVALSINTYAVQLLDQIGIRRSFDFARAMGLELVETPGNNDLGLAPLALGGLTRGATPLQMAAAYGSIGNGGTYMEPHFVRKIVNADGEEIYLEQTKYHRVMSDQTSWLMSDVLHSVVTSGTGTNASIPGVFTTGKTGTSEEYKDSWFLGFTPAFSASVWMGYDQEHTMSNVYGGGYPAGIFRSMLQKAHQKSSKSSLRPMPASIVRISVCSKSGKQPSEACPEDEIISEWCLKSAVPADTCDRHEFVAICPESNKLAGEFCPNPEMRSMIRADEKSYTPNKIPTESCDIHTEHEFSMPGFLSDNSNEVYICTDPRHKDKLYRANVPSPLQSGGCPQQYLEKIILQEGQELPFCPLEDHQLKSKKPSEIVDNLSEKPREFVDNLINKDE